MCWGESLVYLILVPAVVYSFLNFSLEIQNSRFQILDLDKTFGTVMSNSLCGYKCFLRTLFLMLKMEALTLIAITEKPYTHMWNCWPFTITQTLNYLGHCVKQVRLPLVRWLWFDGLEGAFAPLFVFTYFVLYVFLDFLWLVFRTNFDHPENKEHLRKLFCCF